MTEQGHRSAKQESASALSRGPFFVVGCPRSGTTLLQRMLGARDDVAIAPETHFVRRFWLRRLRYRSLDRDGNYRRLLDDVVAMPEFGDMGLEAGRYRDAAWAGPRTYARLFGLLLEQFAAARNASRVGEKTPSHARYIRTLRRFFPDAVFVHILRDPRAVVNSWRGVPWSTGLAGGDAEVWRRHVAGVREAASSVGNAVHTVHYEHLVARPEESLRALCTFLGIPFDAGMLRFHEREPDSLNLGREPWKARAARALDTAPIDRSRSELSATAVAQVEAVARSEMQRHGYEPERPLWATAPRRLALSPVLAIMRLKERARQVIA